jgi:hypothetical protein
VLAAAVAIPLQSGQSWQVLKYRSIPPNQVEFSPAGLSIKVKSSASPVIYPLPSLLTIKSVRTVGKVIGTLQLPATKEQGTKGADDYQLRVGLVLKGQQRLNFMQRAVAADWVVKLFDLAPKDVGIDRILFLNGTHVDKAVGTERVHPLSELLHERVLWKIPSGGDFDFKYEFPAPVEVLALWLSSDGDDTASTYEVQLTQLELAD